MKIQAVNQVHEGLLLAKARLVCEIGPPLGLFILGDVQSAEEALDIAQERRHFEQRQPENLFG